MTITCTLEELHRITKENPSMTIAEFIAMLQVKKAVNSIKKGE